MSNKTSDNATTCCFHRQSLTFSICCFLYYFLSLKETSSLTLVFSQPQLIARTQYQDDSKPSSVDIPRRLQGLSVAHQRKVRQEHCSPGMLFDTHLVFRRTHPNFGEIGMIHTWALCSEVYGGSELIWETPYLSQKDVPWPSLALRFLWYRRRFTWRRVFLFLLAGYLSPSCYISNSMSLLYVFRLKHGALIPWTASATMLDKDGVSLVKISSRGVLCSVTSWRRSDQGRVVGS